jgi:hypothetical protein
MGSRVTLLRLLIIVSVLSYGYGAQAGTRQASEQSLSVREELRLSSGRTVTMVGTFMNEWLFRVFLDDTGGVVSDSEYPLVTKFVFEQLKLHVRPLEGKPIAMMVFDTRLDPNLDKWLIDRVRAFFRTKHGPLVDVKLTERELAKVIDSELAKSAKVQKLGGSIAEAAGQSIRSVRLARETWSLQRGVEIGKPLASYQQTVRGGFSIGPFIEWIFACE